MAKLSSKIAKFFESRPGRGLLIAAALLLAYVFVSWAIDSGSVLDWAIAIILLIIAVREATALFKQSFSKKQ